MELKIEYVPVVELQEYEYNAKIHTGEQIEQIKKSIEEFGFNDPIAIWKDNVIIEGHGRLMAATELGMKKVPVIRLDDLTDEQRRAYALVHNQLTMNTGFDFDVLEKELESISDIDMSFFDFDLFEEPEIEKQTEEISEDNYEAKLTDETTTKQGDVWVLGNHRLICGDSTDPGVMEKLMDGETADIAITSPPYGMSKSAGIRKKYKPGQKRMKSLYNTYDDDPDEWLDLMRESLNNMRLNSKSQFINVQMLAGNKRQLIQFLHEYSNYLADIIVWKKNKAAPQMENGVLNNGFEFIFVFGSENASRVIPFSRFHGTESNVFEIGIGQNEFADVHKAVYPVELPAKIMNLTADATSVLDVFGGTGTTMIACEQLGRKCYMAELDPQYCDVIIRRWEKFTGETAVLLNDKVE